MLELDKIVFRNFMSYGDYDTELQLSNQGQCFISGEVLELYADREQRYLGFAEHDSKANYSNGAGKSCLMNSLLWALFGRTMHTANPGDNVMNWHTGKPCRATLSFKNGDFITRVREKGRTELLFVRGGDERKLVADTLGTSKAMQHQLNREFGLDWDILCGSVFFSQYGRPWMEMPDATRKQVIERALHADRYNVYAEVTKSKCIAIDKERLTLRERAEQLKRRAESQRKAIADSESASSKFDELRAARVAEANADADGHEAKAAAIQLPDLEQLKSKWDLIGQISGKISGMRSKAAQKRAEARSPARLADGLDAKVDEAERRIKLWTSKMGKVCVQCEQEVPHDHVGNKVTPIRDELERLKSAAASQRAEAAVLENEAAGLEAAADSAEDKLDEKKPKITMDAAKALHREHQLHKRNAAEARARAERAAVEVDPHGDAVKRAAAELAKIEAELVTTERKLVDYDSLWQHYSYVGKAYSDRRKVKSYAFSRYIPFINSRLEYYLGVFGLDLKLEFTDSLGIKTSRWGYDYYCGGERKRTDVALMLAMFDMHREMYDDQCNVVVLDEVDGRMDVAGIESLIQVIKNDVSSKAESVFVISHRQQMADVFPRQIKVSRTDRMSTCSRVA